MISTLTYNPDYCVHPGEILEEQLEVKNYSRTLLASKTGLNIKTISQIINKKTNISADTALLFEKALGVSAEIWNNLDANYRLFQAKQHEKQLLEKKIEWLNDFPILEMKKKGYIKNTKDNIELLQSVLDYFGVSSPEAWDQTYKELTAVYRRSPNTVDNKEYICTWLRAGIIQAGLNDIPHFNKPLFKNNLELIKQLTVEDADVFQTKMIKLCHQAGVHLVFEPEYPNMKIYGATLWINQNNPLIMLSLRRKSDDQFWFSFFHEAGHIIKHGKKDIFIDIVNYESNKYEDEADDFARNTLISKTDYSIFIKKNRFYKNTIAEFAKELNIAPGIIVGFLQHDKKIDIKWLNDLKRKFEFIKK